MCRQLELIKCDVIVAMHCISHSLVLTISIQAVGTGPRAAQAQIPCAGVRAPTLCACGSSWDMPTVAPVTAAAWVDPAPAWAAPLPPPYNNPLAFAPVASSVLNVSRANAAHQCMSVERFAFLLHGIDSVCILPVCGALRPFFTRGCAQHLPDGHLVES